MLYPAAAANRSVEEFLDALAATDRRTIAARDLAIVVAHPDDETIGCGGQLNRLEGATIVVVTDGAPRNVNFSGPEGNAAYAGERAYELRRALAKAEVADRNIVMLGFSDQSAALHLADLTRTLYRLAAARDLHLLLTHAYEGGHPDHDATCFAVHLAATLRRLNGEPTQILEMPLYRAGKGTWLRQTFAPDATLSQRSVRLSAEARERKQRMLDIYESQRATLSPFATDVESFRRAPSYDFTVLPNGGALLYERYDWGMTGARWLALSRDALRELGFASEPCH